MSDPMSSVVVPVSSREEHHYIPILKGKKGEFDALGGLDPYVKDRLTPMIEVVPVTWDYTKLRFTRELDEHFHAVINQLDTNWGANRPIWIDTLWSEEDDNVDGVPATEYLFDAARMPLAAVPVGGPGRPHSHTASLAKIHKLDKRGVVMRLDPEDLEDPGALLVAINAWLSAVGVGPEQVDLVADFQVVQPSLLGTLRFAIPIVLGALPHLQEWRSLTLASGAFPDPLQVSPNTIERVSRDDWKLWDAVRHRVVGRTPAYADYAITHPVWTDLDPRLITPSVAIRYTSPSDWVIVKRSSIRKGFGQFHDASRLLQKADEWRGKAHCPGCAFIDACAAGAGPGNLTTWRRVGTSHHLRETVDRLASLP